jgi:putative NADPH-quinone reductase
MKILFVFCHPRRASLTGAIADAFVEGAVAASEAHSIGASQPRG